MALKTNHYETKINLQTQTRNNNCSVTRWPTRESRCLLLLIYPEAQLKKNSCRKAQTSESICCGLHPRSWMAELTRRKAGPGGRGAKEPGADRKLTTKRRKGQRSRERGGERRGHKQGSQRAGRESAQSLPAQPQAASVKTELRDQNWGEGSIPRVTGVGGTMKSVGHENEKTETQKEAPFSTVDAWGRDLAEN